MHSLPRVVAAVVCTTVGGALAACGPSDADFRPTVIPPDAARLAAARPRLAEAARVAAAIAAGTVPCDSPVVGYDGCERDAGIVLLLAEGTVGGAGSRVDALLWLAPGRSPATAVTLFWHVDGPGAPLGHGWHHVTAVSHID